MKVVIHITAAEVIEKAREAFLKGELQCQQPDFRDGAGCFYNGPCVIGVALPPSVREWLDNEYQGPKSIRHLIVDGIIQTDYVQKLIYLQSLHDAKHINDLGEALGLEQQHVWRVKPDVVAG